MEVDRRIADVTQRLIDRSRPTRERYLERIADQAGKGPHRAVLSCGNLAHGFAACGVSDKQALSGETAPNLGIVT
ncbi:MAG: phosphogluconate dehydratase, partial [Nitratireductor sp.]|nr:phosphogluconate dehydratase [Nitratireductor sp.]